MISFTCFWSLHSPITLFLYIASNICYLNCNINNIIILLKCIKFVAIIILFNFFLSTFSKSRKNIFYSISFSKVSFTSYKIIEEVKPWKLLVTHGEIVKKTRITTSISSEAQRNQTSILIRGWENQVSPKPWRTARQTHVRTDGWTLVFIEQHTITQFIWKKRAHTNNSIHEFPMRTIVFI